MRQHQNKRMYVHVSFCFLFICICPLVSRCPFIDFFCGFLFGYFQLCVAVESLGQLINPFYCVVSNCET